MPNNGKNFGQFWYQNYNKILVVIPRIKYNW